MALGVNLSFVLVNIIINELIFFIKKCLLVKLSLFLLLFFELIDLLLLL